MRPFILVSAAMLAFCLSARADVITTYTLSGDYYNTAPGYYYTDLGPFTGTMVLNNTTGEIISFSSPSISFTDMVPGEYEPGMTLTSTPTSATWSYPVPSINYHTWSLTVTGTGLSGFAGNVTGGTFSAVDYLPYYYPPSGPPVRYQIGETGTITPAVAAPEISAPGTLSALALLGGATLIACERKRLRN